MQEKFLIKVLKNPATRLDNFLSENFNQSRNFWIKKIKEGNVLLDGNLAKPHSLVKVGQTIKYIPDKKKIGEKEKILRPEIIYEDKDFLAINKPAGMLVYSTNQEEKTLVDSFRDKTKDSDKLRPGIVHRLDRDTSGIILIAKNSSMKKYLKSLFKGRKIKKTYLALVWGKLNFKKAKLDLPITRSRNRRHKMAVSSLGKKAISVYKTIKQYPNFSLIEIQLITGRTHQIRTQFEYLGHPLVGDKIYGKRKTKGLNRQFLHAKKIELKLPSGKQLILNTKLPQDLQKFLISYARLTSTSKHSKKNK